MCECKPVTTYKLNDPTNHHISQNILSGHGNHGHQGQNKTIWPQHCHIRRVCWSLEWIAHKKNFHIKKVKNATIPCSRYFRKKVLKIC